VACINIAAQVARQLNTTIGKLVGYHIGTDPCVSKETQISFVTIGIFLNYLIHDPSKLKNYDCIILDEVHERDLNLDFVLMILKILLTKIKTLKVILMSATLETDKIA
jgi:HrpA-like RNA helicase